MSRSSKHIVPSDSTGTAQPVSPASARWKNHLKFVKDHLSSGNQCGLNPAYWLEAKDPKHREGKYLAKKYDLWISEKHADKNFFSWLDEKEKTKKNIKKNHLDYYGNERQRQQFKLGFKNGLIYCNGKILDTIMAKGKRPRYFAFVVDENGMYAAPHVSKKFHHSSFLAGSKVLFSGMIKIEKGKVRTLNNWSGHYRTPLSAMVSVVDMLSKENVLSMVTKVKVINMESNNKFAKWAKRVFNSTTYTVSNFLDTFKAKISLHSSPMLTKLFSKRKACKITPCKVNNSSPSTPFNINVAVNVLEKRVSAFTFASSGQTIVAKSPNNETFSITQEKIVSGKESKEVYCGMLKSFLILFPQQIPEVSTTPDKVSLWRAAFASMNITEFKILETTQSASIPNQSAKHDAHQAGTPNQTKRF